MTQPPMPTAVPDPEIALIAETLRDYRTELRQVRTDMAEAEARHREEMAAAERRHREAMSDAMGKLAEREKTIVRLEAMLDTVTGRQPPPPQRPQPPPR